MKTTSIFLALTAAAGVFAAAAPNNEARGDYDYNPYKPKCYRDKCARFIKDKHNKHPPLEVRLHDCKEFQVTKVYKWKPPVTTTDVVTVTITPPPKYCPPPKHHDHDHDHDKDHHGKDDKYPPPKHYPREAEAEAEPEAEPDDYKPPPYYPPHVPSYASYYCPTPDRYAKACECVGYPKVTKIIWLGPKTYHTTKTKTHYAPPSPCPKPPHHDYPPPKKDY